MGSGIWWGGGTKVQDEGPVIGYLMLDDSKSDIIFPPVTSRLACSRTGTCTYLLSSALRILFLHSKQCTKLLAVHLISIGQKFDSESSFQLYVAMH